MNTLEKSAEKQKEIEITRLLPPSSRKMRTSFFIFVLQLGIRANDIIRTFG